ncbi:hypothetical protein ANN_14234 [Periplaneta americana]|uniref:Endonuclease/exonuclease/phosphatase domain-containing protein n=1 Tax=Periplaneta americana TaxID=6978 RepID=A0ABQ8SVR9_PERAM|nr:hypothetical protein ANN_14234 [Periplaneta americana]
MAGLCEGGNKPLGSLKASKAHEDSRPTNWLLASRPYAEGEVDDHPTRMEHTNEEAERRSVEETSPSEIFAFIGTLILMGANNYNNLDYHDLWSQELGMSVYIASMSRNRFLDLLSSNLMISTKGRLYKKKTNKARFYLQDLGRQLIKPNVEQRAATIIGLQNNIIMSMEAILKKKITKSTQNQQLPSGKGKCHTCITPCKVDQPTLRSVDIEEKLDRCRLEFPSSSVVERRYVKPKVPALSSIDFLMTTGVNNDMDMNMASQLEHEIDTDSETLSALSSDTRMNTSDLEEILQDAGIGSNIKTYIIQAYAERAKNKQVNKRVRDSSQYFVLAGDYNAKHQQWNSFNTCHRGRQLARFVQESGFTILAPTEPTHYPYNPRHAADMIDFVILERPLPPLVTYTLPELQSDHSPVLLELSATYSPSNSRPHCPLITTNWNTYKYTVMLHFPKPANVEDAHVALNIYSSTLREIYRKYTTISLPANSFKEDQTLRELLRLKRASRKRWQLHRDRLDLQLRRNLAKRIKKELYLLTEDKLDKEIQEA